MQSARDDGETPYLTAPMSATPKIYIAACLHSLLPHPVLRGNLAGASATKAILTFAVHRLWAEVPMGMGTQNQPEAASLAATSR